MILSEELSSALDAARADASRGQWSMARDRLARVQDSFGDRPDAQVLFAEALIWTGDPAGAVHWLLRALPLVARHDDRGRLRRSHLLAGAAGFQLGELDEAITHFDRAFELARADGDDLVAAQATNNLGAIADLRGERLDALSRYRAAVPAYQRLGHVRGLAETVHNMAITYREQGDLVKAEELELDAVRYAQEAGDARLAALAHLERAVIRLRLHDEAFAIALAEMAAREFQRLGLGANEADAFRVQALARHQNGDSTRALRDLDHAIELISKSPSRFIEAECHRDRAAILASVGDRARARQDARIALDYFQRLGANRESESVRALLRTLGD